MERKGILGTMHNIIINLFGRHKHERHGELHVSGRGRIEIPLPFKPKKAHAEFEGHAHHHGPCCEVHRHDVVAASVHRVEDGWGIVLTWDVCSDRKVKWKARK